MQLFSSVVVKYSVIVSSFIDLSERPKNSLTGAIVNLILEKTEIVFNCYPSVFFKQVNGSIIEWWS